jgi:hypothetical protein
MGHGTANLMRSQDTEELGRRLRDLEEQLPGLDELRERLLDANRRALRFVREQPGACLVGALAAGFVIGRIIRARG